MFFKGLTVNQISNILISVVKSAQITALTTSTSFLTGYSIISFTAFVSNEPDKKKRIKILFEQFTSSLCVDEYVEEKQNVMISSEINPNGQGHWVVCKSSRWPVWYQTSPPPPRILLPVSVNSRKEINLRLLAANLSVEPVFTFGPDLPFGARNLFHHTSVGPVMKYCTLQKISTGWHSIIS